MNGATAGKAGTPDFLLDGETPVPKPVRITLGDAGLHFQSAAARRPEEWEFAMIDWDASRHINGQLRLKHGGDHDMWLIVNDPERAAAILAAKKIWARQNFRNFRHTRREASLILRATIITVLVCGTLWFSWPYLTAPLVALVPDSTSAWLGKTAQEALGMTKECRTPEGDAALQRLMRKLAGSDPRLRRAAAVVTKRNMVNALTLADDRILVTSAIIEQAGSSDEIAGILAHELGHVAHRHVLRGAAAGVLIKLLMTAFTGSHGEILGYAHDLTALAHSRRFEAEADAAAVEYLRGAHISTQDFGAFFRRMGNDSPQGAAWARYLSAHPPSAEREAMMLQTPVSHPQPAMPATDWQALQAICR